MTSSPSSPNPMYISAHSAETILSDFRPLKLQTEALAFLNLLLDDILANIITFSRSILTDRLKTGLLKTIPTTVGKDALLEAEMELRAYWQRPNANKPSASQASSSEYSFSLPSMIELMRLKCEAYSTLNDSDEDAQAENIIQERLRSQGLDPPKSIIVAPAALYLTAILECICERILSSVGRVATRDSGKDAAGTHDLFVALCEDDAIYPIFKDSKVYDVIESSSKHSSKPQRSKSFSRSERGETRDIQSADPLSQTRSRLSFETAASGVVSGSVGSDNHPPRTSMEKGKAIKLFRPSSDRDANLSSDAASRVTASRKGFSAQSDGINDGVVLDSEDGNLMQDFDDLMRSGDTMKVSLTPDRLRTMETAKQQQQRQLLSSPRRTGKIPPNDHSSRARPAADADGRHSLSSGQHDARKPSVSHVDSITEDEEPREAAVSSRAASSHSVSRRLEARTRSVSASGISHGLGLQVTRKPSLGMKNPPPSFGRLGRDSYASNNPSTAPQRKRKIQKNRESMDIDAIMNGSEGSESSPDLGDQATQGRAPLYPVSKATKDFISFLEEGPPPDIQPSRPATVSSVSLTQTTKSPKGGSRLQRMISKLNLSKEDRILQDSPRGRGVGTTSAPSTPVVSSMRTSATNYLPPLPAPKPVPPPILPTAPSMPLSSPPSQLSPEDDDARSVSRNDRRPRKMSVRKAVPNWDTVDQGVPAPPIKDTARARPMHTPSPSTASPTSPIQNGQPHVKEANGHTHDKPKVSRSDSPVETPTPAPIILKTPSHSPSPRGNGNGQAEQPHPQDVSRPKSLRPNHRSSLDDEQASQAGRTSGRQPQPTKHQSVTPTPSLPEPLALDLRKLLSQATTANECRFLFDTFLTRAGIAPPFSPVLDTTPSDIEPLERTLVHHFLGSDPDEFQLSPFQPMKVDEAVQHPPLSASEHPPVQERNDLDQSTTTPMDSEDAVHAHHITRAEVAIVS